jgi:soluble lytic murein transglycosylase-like protein
MMSAFHRGLSRIFRLALVLAVPAAFASEALASPPPLERAKLGPRNVCEIISREARRRDLPENFLARLIWQESSFNPSAVSPVGAQGIAQFMPETARERGLSDPFAPQEALPASADLLSDLHKALGNLGLAAAAYNAGASRVKRWLAGVSGLPAETRDYVHSITGRPASDWTDMKARHSIPPIGEAEHFISDCVKLASRGVELPQTRTKTKTSARSQPWGVQVAGSHSETAALASFAQLKARHPDLLGDIDPLILRKRNPGMGAKRVVNVRIGAASRAEADKLCAKLLAKGSACVVLKN